MIACIQKLLERLGIIDHVEDTAWNTHGNTATTDGAAGNPLKISGASLWIDNNNNISGLLGDYPTGAEYQGSGVESKLLWIGDKYAFRAGAVTGTEWDDANIGLSSFAIGLDAKASNDDSIAIGNSSVASGSGSIAIGQRNTSINQNAVTIGVDNVASGISSYVIGRYAQATGFVNCFTIGSGASLQAPLVNSKSNSMVIGFGSATGTLFLQQGKCGVLKDTPLSTLDIGGSVGYQFTNLEFSADTPYTPTGDELCFSVNFTGAGTGNTFVFNLPTITASAFDRRMYHITNEATTRSDNNIVQIVAPSGHYINTGTGSGFTMTSAGSFTFRAGESLQIVAAFSGYDNGAGRQPTWRVI